MNSLWPTSNPLRDILDGEDATALVWTVWKWIGDHHEHSYTADDLIQELEEAGYPCPDELKEN